MYRIPEASTRELFIVAGNERIVALRRRDGALAWHHVFAEDHGIWGPQTSAPTEPLAIEFVGERLFVGLTHMIVCLEYATGRVLGQVKLPEHAARPQLLFDGEDVFAISHATVLCLDTYGNLRWSAPHGLSTSGSPAIGFPGNVRPGDSFGWK